MSNRKVYRIKLTKEERDTFAQVSKGKRGKLKIAGWKVQRANAMLKCDESEEGPAWPDEKIAEAFGTTTRSMENWRKQAALQGPLSLHQPCTGRTQSDHEPIRHITLAAVSECLFIPFDRFEKAL